MIIASAVHPVLEMTIDHMTDRVACHDNSLKKIGLDMRMIVECKYKDKLRACPRIENISQKSWIYAYHRDSCPLPCGLT